MGSWVMKFKYSNYFNLAAIATVATNCDCGRLCSNVSIVFPNVLRMNPSYSIITIIVD